MNVNRAGLGDIADISINKNIFLIYFICYNIFLIYVHCNKLSFTAMHSITHASLKSRRDTLKWAMKYTDKLN